ncbi:hypothetical protein COT54_01235 [Candidatus Collierbacteria bacterium CG09_land_8_20_14_0_10_46_12]|uniref:50S ribosomal protein L29 n=1 Tax=Candidatus Collierbacteria bacterium CG09_land_8_20_14_0_10_46_12 TaxID=1974533 RepID=A0A2H0WZG7_9BACT|nr:MAG: hypothetical protein COT54_01235 [Candidatus Collierbacteria bacterium CG09_land_8_20_14_0_10_46_12]
MTKLRKNDYQELRKAGIAAIDAKILELLVEHDKTMMLKMKNELKNPRALAVIHLAIAKLKTIKTELKEVL